MANTVAKEPVFQRSVPVAYRYAVVALDKQGNAQVITTVETEEAVKAKREQAKLAQEHGGESLSLIETKYELREMPVSVFLANSTVVNKEKED